MPCRQVPPEGTVCAPLGQSCVNLHAEYPECGEAQSSPTRFQLISHYTLMHVMIWRIFCYLTLFTTLCVSSLSGLRGPAQSLTYQPVLANMRHGKDLYGDRKALYVCKSHMISFGQCRVSLGTAGGSKTWRRSDTASLSSTTFFPCSSLLSPSRTRIPIATPQVPLRGFNLCLSSEGVAREAGNSSWLGSCLDVAPPCTTLRVCTTEEPPH